jgi:hypothetical protein
MAKRNKMAETEYEDIYQLFAEKRYHQVIVRTSAAVQIYTKEEGLIPKYKYWNAIALAKTNKTSDAISMLENWEASKGARIEHDLAVACGKSIIAVYSGAIRK